MFSVAWFVMTLPFRLVFGVIGAVGRMISLAMGFILLATGAAMWAAQLPHFAVPVIAAGALLTIKSIL
ncbi:MAG: hypothetical protein ACKO85_22265 [Isosphaeraceae bacterium]